MTTVTPDHAPLTPEPVPFAPVAVPPVAGTYHGPPRRQTGDTASHEGAPRRSLLTRVRRGPDSDPGWVRPTLVSLLAVTGLLYVWGLGANGWANAFYSAAVQAGSQSWKAFLFGSSDAANFITVDKPPASLWVMELSARIFGVSSWSILVPEALMGVATVGLVYLAVRRVATPAAGLIAGAVVALTPVATLMFRFNNPDAFLVLLLSAAAYTTVRAVERASWRWLVATGVLVGFAFLTKSLQAFLPLPAFALAYLVAAPTTFWRRVRDLLVAGAAMVVAAGWWIVLVELWPASSRPYIGGSQTNSVWELIWGYNGLGRITGNETGSVTPGGNGGAGAWGATGWDRLFTSSFGGQIAWLIPAALALALVLFWITRRAPRTDGVRASAIVWLGWLLLTGLTISYAQGIIHEYYTVAVAPAIGALVGLGGTALWARRDEPWARITLAFVVAGTSVWAAILLGRSADWYPALRFVVLALGLASALAILVVERFGRRLALTVGLLALVSVLLAPTAYSLQTASTAHTGSLPTAGPTVSGARGFGPGGGGRPTGGFGGGGFGGGNGGPGGMPPGGTGTGTGTGAVTGAAPTLPAGATAGTGTGTGAQSRGGFGGGAAGGLLDASTPGAALVTALETDAGSYTWAAAAVGAQTAAGYQLATGLPVMSLGGFNGSDPWPTLDVFKTYVADHQVHYFIASGGMGGGGGGANGGSSATSEITSWVEANFTATTIDGATVYDLSSPTSSTATSGTTS